MTAEVEMSIVSVLVFAGHRMALALALTGHAGFAVGYGDGLFLWILAGMHKLAYILTYDLFTGTTF